jgi:hypothetical protein
MFDDDIKLHAGHYIGADRASSALSGQWCAGAGRGTS